MIRRLLLVVLIVVAAIIFLRPLLHHSIAPAPPSPPPSQGFGATSAPLFPLSPTVDTAAVEAEVGQIHAMLMNFLTVVKDPYRPPLGDNEDITKAMMGGNRLGTVFVQTNDPRVADGKLVDPWGTPLWFHPRAPDAIDVRSAGPDRQLFTADDFAVP